MNVCTRSRGGLAGAKGEEGGNEKGRGAKGKGSRTSGS